MKKLIIPIISCILVGFLFGKIMFNQYEKEETIPTSTGISENVYFIQIGAYSNIDNMKEAMKDIQNYIYINKDDKYYVFVGMTKKKENVEKLKKYFEKKYNIYVKELIVDNKALLDMIDQYDLLLTEATSDESISTIEKTVLAKYEELKNEN